MLKIGLPAMPSQPQIIERNVIPGVLLISVRTDALGVLDESTTVVFEVQAININNMSEVVTKNFTIANYTSFSDVSVTFELLKSGNYTIKSRVFNIYGPSEYSMPTDAIFISGSSKCSYINIL